MDDLFTVYLDYVIQHRNFMPLLWMKVVVEKKTVRKAMLGFEF
jgi:hypothetical protein